MTGLRSVRSVWLITAIVIVLSALVAVVALVGVHRARPVPSDGQRQAVLTAARDALTAVLTYDPAHAEQDRSAAQQHLTGVLAVDYRASGPDLLIPGAVAAGATLSGQVVGVAVRDFGGDRSGDEARVLAFTNENVTLGTSQSGGSSGGQDTRLDDSPAAAARWVRMRDVDGRWLMADLRPVGGVSP